MSENLENDIILPEDEAVPELYPQNAGDVAPAPINRDKALAQLDAYKRCFTALQAELADIEQQFGANESSGADDPLKALTDEVSGFKGEMAELRKMLEDLWNAPAGGQTMPQQQQPQQQFYYQPQPQMVTPAPLPYIQTPNFTPLMPAMPTFNR